MTELDERYLLALYRSSENPSKHVFGNSHFRLWRLLDRGCVALIPPRLTAVGMAAAQQLIQKAEGFKVILQCVGATIQADAEE